jgi:asparagine N-glycosylation enzyme membrane subunit Stt3
MEQSKLKSTLELQRIKNEMGYISVNRAVNKHQRNLELVKNGTDAAEKTLAFVILVNVLLAFAVLILNHLNQFAFNKDFILSIISEFNILLPLLMTIPIISIIIKSFLSDNDNEKKLNFSVLGKIIGTFTILTLIPFISIVMTYIIKTQLI